MPEQMTTDVRAILDRDPFDASAVADLHEVLGRDPSRYKTLRDAAAAMAEREKASMKPHVHLRLGVADVLLGRYTGGLEQLAKAGDNGLAHFFRGLALQNLQRWTDAAKAFAASAKAGYEPKKAELNRAGCLRHSGEPAAARTILDGLKSLATSSAEYHYQLGSFMAADGDLIAASAELEKALSIERDHTGALFELAYINDLYGSVSAALPFRLRR
jgi:DNA-directed RNA polymerase subunit alpha